MMIGAILKVFATIWGVLGVGNIVMTTGGSGMLLLSFLFNFMVFVFPAIIIYYVGEKMVK